MDAGLTTRVVESDGVGVLVNVAVGDSGVFVIVRGVEVDVNDGVAVGLQPSGSGVFVATGVGVTVGVFVGG